MAEESRLEADLRKAIGGMGGLWCKWVSPGNAGVPDRICILPGGKVYFVELKAPRGKPSAIQDYWGRRLTALGCSYRLIIGRDQARDFLEEVKSAIHGA